ncbi:MAG: substrate-binding domain-containing protein [Treponema sp.]|nr:substrate-binding domain-containing protein [Treponema sp.]
MKLNLKKIATVTLIAAATSTCFAWGFFGGKSKKWNKKSTINVLSREEGSGTRGAFIELFGIEKKDSSGKKVDYTTDEAAITNSTAVMLTSVSSDKYAIGYVSLGSLNSSVKALKINGALASVENINNGSYQVSRPFNIAVKDNLSDAAKDLVAYILSDEGQRIVSANKYINIIPNGAYKTNGASGKVIVSGSSSVSPVMEKIIEAYKKANPTVNVELQTSDSTTGVTNAINGTCDIGMASRAIKETEKAKGVKDIKIAIDGIAVIVNNENPADNLSKAQVNEIFTGETDRWSTIVK